MNIFPKWLIKTLVKCANFAGLMAVFISICHAQTNSELKEHTASFWDDINTQRQIQGGVDAWKIQKNLGLPGHFDNNSLLYLADSQPHGSYENPSPWLKVDALAQSGNWVFRLRYDNNQSLGSRFDELSMDWLHHTFGIRAGVLGYKVSWCRTNDVDSPWMRENDPFCVAQSSSRPIRSSPGIQAYLNSQISSFKVQSVIGMYSPLIINYDTSEFTNFTGPAITVIENNKYGISINAMDLNNGLELRLSYLRSDQVANASPTNTPTYRMDQHADVLYAAISNNISPVINLRLSQFNSNEHASSTFPLGYVAPGDSFPGVFNIYTRQRISQVVELNYQFSARDVFSFAYSKYNAYDKTKDARRTTSSPEITYLPTLDYKFQNTSKSVAWRRDWKKGVFTIVQITYADSIQKSETEFGVVPTQYSQSTGQAVGLRLGYSF